MNKNYIILFILIIIPIAINPYPWPIQPFNTQHPITATFGEYRPPYGSLGKHFHWGVDIGESNGVSVFSVKSGVIEEKGNEYVIIDNYRYVHITPKVNIGDSVIAFIDTIGTIKDIGASGIAGDHLHFAEGMGGISNRVNPLRTGGLTPYADSAMPAVYGGNNYRFYRHGENNIITSPLYGKVDILTKAKDAQSNGSNIVGVYRIGYQVNDEEGNTILPYTENIKFDNVNGILDSIYGSESDISNYYYWVTNALSANNCYRYWNTKLRKGQAWDGDDADFNSEAEYPDGEYRVWVLAYDINGNGGDTLNQDGAEYKDIIIDNFLPEISNIFACYKKGFSIRYSEVMNYNSATNITNYSLMGNFTYISINSITQDIFDPQVFHITTSQEMGYNNYNLSLHNVEDLAGNVIDTNITFAGSAASIPLYGMKIVDLPLDNNKKGTRADESFNDILNPGERVHLKPEFLNMYNESVMIYSESLANMPEYNIIIDTGLININESVEPDSLISLPKPFSIKIPENYDSSEIGFKLINSNSCLGEYVKDIITFYVPVNKRIASISGVSIDDSPELGICNTGDGIVDNHESTNVYISLKNNDQDTLKNVIITTKLMVNDNYKEDINLSNNRLYYGNIGPYEHKIPSTLLKLNTNGLWNREEDIVLVISITYILNNKSYWEMSNWYIPGYKQYSDSLNLDTLFWLGAFSPNNDGYKDSINIPFHTAYSYPIGITYKDTFPRDTTYHYRDRAEKLGMDIYPEKAYKEYDGPFEKGTNYSVDWDGNANKEIEDGKHYLNLREPISGWYILGFYLRHSFRNPHWLYTENEYFLNSNSSSKYSLLIDRVPPSIFNIECDKPIFSNGDKTKVNFYTSESCSVWVKISDINNSSWLKDLDTDFVHNNKEFVWYGTNNSGDDVPPGFYNFHIYARDFSNPATEKVITLQIDNSVPYLNIEKPIWN